MSQMYLENLGQIEMFYSLWQHMIYCDLQPQLKKNLNVKISKRSLKINGLQFMNKDNIDLNFLEILLWYISFHSLSI